MDKCKRLKQISYSKGDRLILATNLRNQSYYNYLFHSIISRSSRNRTTFVSKRFFVSFVFIDFKIKPTLPSQSVYYYLVYAQDCRDVPIGIYLSYRFARTIALKTLRRKTKPTRTETVNSMGHEACQQSRSSVFRANETASQAPIANSNSNHAPRSVRLRTKIKLCAGNRSNRNTPFTTKLERSFIARAERPACHISLGIIA